MPPSVARESERGPALQQELQAQQESESNKVRVSLLVDEDTVSCGIFPKRKFAWKPCTSACERPSVSSLTFGKDFPAADVASKSRRPSSRSRPQSRGGRTFREPLRPEPVVAQGQGRVDCRGRGPREHLNPRHHPQGQRDRDRVCPLSHSTHSRPILRFPCIRRDTTSGNKEGRCLLQKPPKQEDTRSSPLLSMELKRARHSTNSRVRPRRVRPVRWQIKGCQTTEPRTFDSRFCGKVNLSTLGF